jgi:hypothetical protein
LQHAHEAWAKLFDICTTPHERIRWYMEKIRQDFSIYSLQQLQAFSKGLSMFPGLTRKDYKKGNAFYPCLKDWALSKGGFDQVQTGFITLGHLETAVCLPLAKDMQHQYGSRYTLCAKGKNIVGITHAMRPMDKGAIVDKLRHEVNDPETTVVAFGDSPHGGDQYLFKAADVRIGVYDKVLKRTQSPRMKSLVQQGVLDAHFTANYTPSGPIMQYLTQRLHPNSVQGV